MSPRIIPAALASIGFLVTFTARSWQAGLWHSGRTADYATASAPLHFAAARKIETSTLGPWLVQDPPVASVISRHGGHGPKSGSMLVARSPPLLTNAAKFLDERIREESHSSRMR